MLFHRQPHNRFRTSRDILAEEGLSTVGCGNLFYDVEPQNVRCIIGCFVRMKSCENFRRIAFSVICYCQAEKILCYFYLCVNRNFHKTRNFYKISIMPDAVIQKIFQQATEKGAV